MYSVHSDKDIVINDVMLIVNTEQQNFSIPLDTINHTLLRRKFKNGGKAVDLLTLFSKTHVVLHEIQFADSITAERLNSILTDKIQNRKEKEHNHE